MRFCRQSTMDNGSGIQLQPSSRGQCAVYHLLLLIGLQRVGPGFRGIPGRESIRLGTLVTHNGYR